MKKDEKESKEIKVGKRAMRGEKGINKGITHGEWRKLKSGYIYSFKITGWKSYVQGIVQHLGDDHVLLLDIPVDFVIDGIKIIPKNSIKSIDRGNEEKFKESVIRATRGAKRPAVNRYTRQNLFETMGVLKREGLLVQIEPKSEGISYIGKIMSWSKDELVIRAFSPNAKWLKRMILKVNAIRVVVIKNDYVNSLTDYKRSLK